MNRLIFTAALLLFVGQVTAQSDWQSAGTIYSDNNVTVVMEFKPGKDYCNSNLKPGRYRYIITSATRNLDYFITWCMDYYDCKGNLICQTNNLDLKRYTGTPNLADLDWTIEGEQVETPFYNVTSGNQPKNTPPYIKRGPKLLAPNAISGNTKLKYGESTRLTVQGGNLSKGAEWRWYSNQCGNNYVGSGDNISVTPDSAIVFYVRGESPTEQTTCASVMVTVNPDSEPANDVLVRRLSCTGDKTLILSVSGGRLGRGANWVWFEGNCGGVPIGTGASINVLPSKRTTYFVQAKGNSNTTPCFSVITDAAQDAIDPSSVNGPAFACSGNKINMEVIGGRLALGQQWTWYQNSLQPGNRIGTGQKINIIARKSTTYIVRGEGPCGTTGTQSLNIIVGEQSSAATHISGTSQVYQGQKVKLGLTGGRLGEAAKWVWYRNNCGSNNKLGTGEQLSLRVRKKQTIYARAEGECGTSNCVSTTLTPLSRFTFVNVGYRANSTSGINSIGKKPFNDSLDYVITLGRVKAMGWYVRAKLSPRKKVTGVNNTVNTGLSDYNNPVNFTRFSGTVVEDRFAVTAGLIMGRKNFFYYGGLGFGQRNVYWGFDEFALNNGVKVNNEPQYAKNTDLSVSGFELEAGLLIRVSFLNIMGGVSGVYSAKEGETNKKHIDAHLGIGISF